MAKAKEQVEQEEIVEQVPVNAEEEKVTIRIPLEKRNQEDVVVWVNDRRFLIKRGVSVDVPKSVADILEQQEAMLQRAFDYEDKAPNKV